MLKAVMAISLLVIFYLPIKAEIKYFDAVKFGAKGDGNFNNYQAFSRMLTIAKPIDSVVFFFPRGSFYVNGANSDNVILDFISMKDGATKYVALVGETGTTIVTDMQFNSIYTPASRIIRVSGSWGGVIVDNINFRNVHPITQGQTTAVMASGYPGLYIKGLKITRCSFDGFSAAIHLNSAVEAVIDSCVFTADKGHDNAQFNSQPATFIRFTSNNNGTVVNPRVTNCYSNGFSGKSLSHTKTKSSMDNFVWGNPNGCNIENNTVENFSEEGIFIFATKNFNSPCIIRKNKLDCNIPANAYTFLKNKTKRTSNYGIRCEALNSVISNNVLTNVTGGIIQYAVENSRYKGMRFCNWTIKENSISITTRKDLHPFYAVYVAGTAPELKAEKILISANSIVVLDSNIRSKFSVFKIAYCKGVRLVKNEIKINLKHKGNVNHIYTLIDSNDVDYSMDNVFFR